MILFNINFNNNEHEFLSSAHRWRNDVAVLNEIDANGVFILNFKKHAFVYRIFYLILVYRKQSMYMQENFQIFEQLTSYTFHRYYSIGF